MPIYWRRTPWRRRYQRKRYYRSRRPYRYWRSRAPLRRRFRLYRRRRRVRKFRKRHFKKKLKYLILKEFQPKKIQKCKIKGFICLFQCGPHRLNREWTQFMTSFYPEYYEGGGGWSQLKFSLESLYEQYQLLRNHWTKSNVLMPLCRYTGCKFIFYRTPDVDYICHYSICYPMLDTVYQHTNAQPNNMFFYPQRILVPSLKTNPHGKLYIKKRIRPPEQFTNKWYFQVDLYKMPLVLLTTTACDLNRYYLNPKSFSNNITLATLNTDLFQNHNFIQTGLGTTWWGPKPSHYLYGIQNGDDDPQVQSLIFLGQTRYYTYGKPIGQTDWSIYSSDQGKKENFGNIFYTRYIHKEFGVFISTTPPNTLFENKSYRTKKISELQKEQPKISIAKLDQDIYKTVRYNPERDTGKDNKIYLVKTSDLSTGWPEPSDEDLIYHGYPLWCLFWGWIDWQEKYKKISKVEKDYICVLKTKFTYPNYTIMVPIDKHFLDGHSTWLNEEQTIEDSISWYPKVQFQTLSIENICSTGPGVARTSATSIEAHAKYCFYFKWGGCPNDLENIIDPGDQKHYPVPNNELQGPEIQDPKSDYKHEIWPFDVRHQMLTKRAAKRIRQDSDSEKTFFTDTKLQSEPTTTALLSQISTPEQTSTEEEEETTPNQQQLQHLKRTQYKLKRRIKSLILQTPRIKY
nr:MAG: ORF1 [TTV-like mini virus]